MGNLWGEVERWIDKASTHELTQAVKKFTLLLKN